MNKIYLLVLTAFLSVSGATWGGEPTLVETPKPDENENSRDLFNLESTYTFRSDFEKDSLGEGDSFYNDFSYDHRFLIKGNWYFRAGFEYERFDFDGTNNGLPDKQQAVYGHLAIEYVVHDHAGVSFEIEPGAYFQNHITGTDSLDIPWKTYVTFPLKKDKVFAVIALGGGLNQYPIVAPGGGIIWLINDHLRLQGVFPRPALVWEPNDNWEFRLLGELLYDSFRTENITTPEFKLRNAVVQYSEIRFGVQAKYSLSDRIKAVMGAGYTVRRNWEFFRADESATVEPAPYVKVGLEARF